MHIIIIMKNLSTSMATIYYCVCLVKLSLIHYNNEMTFCDLKIVYGSLLLVQY